MSQKLTSALRRWKLKAISAGTLSEALIVAARRNVPEELSNLVDEFGFQIVFVTPPRRAVSRMYTSNGEKASLVTISQKPIFKALLIVLRGQWRFSAESIERIDKQAGDLRRVPLFNIATMQHIHRLAILKQGNRG